MILAVDRWLSLFHSPIGEIFLSRSIRRKPKTISKFRFCEVFVGKRVRGDDIQNGTDSNGRLQ
jgi:hypothetical protein